MGQIDAGNYRPVSLATIISKVVWTLHFVLHLTTFGHNWQPVWLQANTWHWHEWHVYFFAQTVSYYVSKDAPVFLVFLDASKAFDRANHNLLFAKLIKYNVPCVHSKTLVELVQATDHARKMRHQLFIPFYCDQWGKAGGSAEPILICCLVFTWMNSRTSWIQPGDGMHCGNYGCE